MEARGEKDTMNPLYPPIPNKSSAISSSSTSQDSALVVNSGESVGENRRSSHSPHDISSAGSRHSKADNASFPSSTATLPAGQSPQTATSPPGTTPWFYLQEDTYPISSKFFLASLAESSSDSCLILPGSTCSGGNA